MLAKLLNIPHENNDWSEWSWSHKLSHDRIRQAIKAQLGYNLTDYDIDPMDPNAIDNFLQNNSQLHGDMNSALHLPGIDLQDVSFKDKSQLTAWINFHYLEHYYAEAKLGVGS